MSDMYILREHGLALVRIYSQEELTARRVEHDLDIISMPELKPLPKGESIEKLTVVGGGTSFAGGSICHAPSTRAIEIDAYDAVFPLLCQEALRLGFPYLAQIKDRVCWRPPGAKPAGESPHRDLSPNSPVNNVNIYGGWVPLNEQEAQKQYFSCVPGSHNVVSNASGGFTPLTKDEVAAFKPRMERICIPLGYMLIFDQRLVHEVVADARDFAIRRVFTAFELAKPDVPPMLQRLGWSPEKITDMWDTQGPFLIKSNQECRTYPKLWAVNWRDKLDHYSRKIVRKWTRDPMTGRVRHVFPAPPIASRHARITDEERIRFAFHRIIPKIEH